MERIRVAIIGRGNTGKAAIEAVNAAPDMELAGVVLRKGATGEIPGVTVTDDIAALGKVDVALLCTPTREMGKVAAECLARGIRTVDSFDIHGDIWAQRQLLDEAAKKSGAAAVVAAGWDPGSDSVVRALLTALAPKGITHTNFGPGMSMGHTVAAKSKPGVKNALSMTIPLGTGVHRRMVYIELADGADFETVKSSILADDYFSHDDSHVILTDDVDALIDRGHGVLMTRKGVSGTAQNQNFSFTMSIDNPALTSSVMAACARAIMKQAPGAYTMIELPVADLLPGCIEEKVRKFV